MRGPKVLIQIFDSIRPYIISKQADIITDMHDKSHVQTGYERILKFHAIKGLILNSANTQYQRKNSKNNVFYFIY